MDIVFVSNRHSKDLREAERFPEKKSNCRCSLDIQYINQSPFEQYRLWVGNRIKMLNLANLSSDRFKHFSMLESSLVTSTNYSVKDLDCSMRLLEKEMLLLLRIDH